MHLNCVSETLLAKSARLTARTNRLPHPDLNRGFLHRMKLGPRYFYGYALKSSLLLCISISLSLSRLGECLTR